MAFPRECERCNLKFQPVSVTNRLCDDCRYIKRFRKKKKCQYCGRNMKKDYTNRLCAKCIKKLSKIKYHGHEKAIRGNSP